MLGSVAEAEVLLQGKPAGKEDACRSAKSSTGRVQKNDATVYRK